MADAGRVQKENKSLGCGMKPALIGAGLKAVVLAAGKGTRLQTGDGDAPKVMRLACGKPLLYHVLDALSFIDKNDIVIVVGYKREEVIGYFGSHIRGGASVSAPCYKFAEQLEQLGTGHAVMAAQPELAGFDGAVLVCYGDMPAVRRDTYEALILAHHEQGNDCTILTGESSDQMSYGRIVRDENGGFLHVVEAGDCTPEQLGITELNSGVYVFRSRMLLDALRELRNDNTQGEYYLTDVPAIMRANGAKVGICKRDLGDEIIGVNTLPQLAQVERILGAVCKPQEVSG